jgi:hypothetical protein
LNLALAKSWLSGAILCLITFGLSQFSTRNLMVLNDGRELYAHDRYFGMNAFDLERFFIFPYDYSRLLSAGTGRAIGNFCGPSSDCINAVNSLLLSIIVLVAFASTLLITRDLKIAFFTIGAWILSASTLNSILWQATQHDKLATLFFFITVSIAVLIFDSDLMSLKKQILCGLLLSFILALSFNTKETTFILPAVLVVLAIVKSIQNRIAIKQIIGVLILPILYSIWYVTYFLNHISPGISSHSFSGNPLTTSVSFLKQSLNLGNFMYLSEYSVLNVLILKVGGVLYVIGFAIFSIFIIAYLTRFDFKRLFLKSFENPLLRILIPFCTLIACLFGILRTEVPVAFYLLLPTWASILLFIEFFYAISRMFVAKQFLFKGAVVLICFAYVSTYSIHFGQNGVVTQLNSSSKNLQKTFDQLNDLPINNKLTIVLEDTNSYGIWYLLLGATSEADKWLSHYFFPRKEEPVQITLGVKEENCKDYTDDFCVKLNSRYQIVSNNK